MMATTKATKYACLLNTHHSIDDMLAMTLAMEEDVCSA